MAAKLIVALAVATSVAAEAGYGGYGGAAYHPYGGSSYTYRSVQGLTGYHGLGKREAEPGYSTGVAFHPTGTSYTSRSPQGLRAYSAPYHYIGKRSASYGGYGPALAHHAYGGVSYTSRSPQGLSYRSHHGKRSAEPSYGGYGGYGYGYARASSASVRVSRKEPYGGHSYGYDIHNIGKRSAEASYYHGGASSFVAESRPLYSYGYGVSHLGKRSAEPGYFGGYSGYGSGASYQRVSRPYSHYGVSVHHG